jgi:transposase InsO family protein
LHNWKWPKEVFSRIHIDYLGPFLNKHFLVILDAHSKWVEVFPTTNITTSFTISALYSVIARFGIPRLIVSDNATNLATSSEFQDFLKAFNIKQITSAPYFPQSNGAAENAVKTVKNALKKAFAVVKK